MASQTLKVFEDKRIRTFWDEQDEKWHFCINDIVAALTDSPGPADYFKTRRKRDKELDDFVRGTNCPTHKFVSTDGKPHAVRCMDLQGIFRIIQSIPSKKAEPFKRWLAQVGAERIHQMQDPELGIQQSLQQVQRDAFEVQTVAFCFNGENQASKEGVWLHRAYPSHRQKCKNPAFLQFGRNPCFCRQSQKYTYSPP